MYTLVLTAIVVLRKSAGILDSGTVAPSRGGDVLAKRQNDSSYRYIAIQYNVVT